MQSANVGMIFSILGILTGMLWARYTWGTWWTTDTKLNGVAITFLIYTAYFILIKFLFDYVRVCLKNLKFEYP